MFCIFRRNHVYLLESASTFLNLMMASVQCSICKSSPGTTTILRDSGSDNIRERIHYCELLMVLFKTDVIKICHKCVERVDECYLFYKNYEGRICEIYDKTPTCCLICRIDDVTVHKHHIRKVVQRERAWHHLTEINLTNFESSFLQVCGECWYLIKMLNYFYSKMGRDSEDNGAFRMLDSNSNDTSSLSDTSSASFDISYEF